MLKIGPGTYLELEEPAKLIYQESTEIADQSDIELQWIDDDDDDCNAHR